MKKKVFGKKLSRERDTRRALFRSLMRAMVLNGKIKTTKAKAKAIQGDVEKIVTLAKSGDVPSRRRLYSLLGNDRATADFVVNKIVPAFSQKISGFTRMVNLPERVGDRAKMVRLEWSLEIEKYIKPLKGKEKAKLEKKKKVKETKENKKPAAKRTLKGLLKKKK